MLRLPRYGLAILHTFLSLLKLLLLVVSCPLAARLSVGSFGGLVIVRRGLFDLGAVPEVPGFRGRFLGGVVGDFGLDIRQQLSRI